MRDRPWHWAAGDRHGDQTSGYRARLSRPFPLSRRDPQVSDAGARTRSSCWPSAGSEHADPDAAAEARHVASASRGAHRHGLSRLRPADRRGHLRGQRRPDAGRQALRSRQGLPPRDLRHVVDPRLDPGIHPALVEPREDGHHGGAEEAVLQPAARQEPDAGAGGRRPAARSGQDDRHQARRARGRRHLA